MVRKPSYVVQLNLRFPEELRRQLERAATAENRSLNAEIVHRLEQSVQREDFQKSQDAMTEGMLEIIDIVTEVHKKLLAQKAAARHLRERHPGLLHMGKSVPKSTEGEGSK